MEGRWKRTRENLTGRRLGRLVVLGPTPRPDHVRPNDARTFWQVVCDCGTEKAVCHGDLLSGTRSCGCLHRERVSKPITFNGETLTRRQWAARLDISATTLNSRLNDLGWPLERALTTRAQPRLVRDSSPPVAPKPARRPPRAVSGTLTREAAYRLAGVLDTDQDLTIGEAAERFAHAETSDPQAQQSLTAAAWDTLDSVAQVLPNRLSLREGLLGHLEAEALGWIDGSWWEPDELTMSTVVSITGRRYGGGRPAENFIGRRYGRLVVLGWTPQPVEVISGRSPLRIFWRCRCDCGTVWPACSYDLRSGKTRSCGCLQRELSRERMQGFEGRPPKPITFNGETLTRRQWAERLGISVYTLNGRLLAGWPLAKALTTPAVTKGGQPFRPLGRPRAR